VEVVSIAECTWLTCLSPSPLLARAGIVACVCQLFYAYRVFVVGKRSIWAPLAITVLALLSLGQSHQLSQLLLDYPNADT